VASISNNSRRDESGATLILALVFIIIGSITVYALVGLSDTNLLNTTGYQAIRQVGYAADGVMDAAIQSVRYDATAGTYLNACPSFPSATGSVVVNGISPGIRVDCVGQNTSGLGTAQRLVNLYACPSNVAAPCPAASSIVSAAILISDTDSKGNPAPGYSLSIQSWSVSGATG
jgi:hypothetical protein